MEESTSRQKPQVRIMKGMSSCYQKINKEKNNFLKDFKLNKIKLRGIQS